MPYSEIDSDSASSAAVSPARCGKQLVENAEATHGHRRLKDHGAEGDTLRVGSGVDGGFFGRWVVRDHGLERYQITYESLTSAPPPTAD